MPQLRALSQGLLAVSLVLMLGLQFQMNGQSTATPETPNLTRAPRKLFLINDDHAFIDINGKVVISASQPELQKEVARISAGFGGLRLSGPDHDWIRFREFSEGYAVIGWALCPRCRNPSWMEGFIDETGKVVIAPQNFEARYGDFHEGLARHFDRGWGFINREGRMVIRGQFYEVADFSDGMAAVRANEMGKFGFINRSGTLAIAFQFDSPGEFHEGLAAVKLSKDSYGFVDKTGRVALHSNDWRQTNNFSEGLAAVLIEFTDNTVYRGYKAQQYGYIDRTGKSVIAPRFDRARTFSEGRALVFQYGPNAGYGFIDPTGQLVVEAKFVDGKDFAEGLASVAIKSEDDQKLWGYIDRAGAWVIEPRFQNANSFSGGLAAVDCNQYGGDCKAYIDPAGEIRWQSGKP